MGCHWEKAVIRNMKTCPCAHCPRAAAGKVGVWVENPIPLWRRHSVIPEGEKEENTHPRRGINKVLTTGSLSPLCYAFFRILKGAEGQSPCLFLLSRDMEGWGCLIMRKGENGTKYSFSSNEHWGGNLFGFGEVKLEKT